MHTSRRIRRRDTALHAPSGALALILLTGLWSACQPAELPPTPRDAAPVVEVFDPAMERLVDVGARFDTLAAGFAWSEGPVWVPALDAPATPESILRAVEAMRGAPT